MSFAIHQSRKHPAKYLCTALREDFGSVPAALGAELGELRFLRMSHEVAEETPALAESYQAIVAGIQARGYHLLTFEAVD
jgi:uncharacterized protein YcgL (UPF0745 family)